MYEEQYLSKAEERLITDGSETSYKTQKIAAKNFTENLTNESVEEFEEERVVRNGGRVDTETSFKTQKMAVDEFMGNLENEVLNEYEEDVDQETGERLDTVEREVRDLRRFD